jgi:hypothetical protein
LEEEDEEKEEEEGMLVVVVMVDWWSWLVVGLSVCLVCSFVSLFGDQN